MKPRLKLWLLSGMTLGVIASCNNINRDSSDMDDQAAISTDTLETMKLSEVGSVGANDPVTIVTDTVPDNAEVASSAKGGDNTYTETEVVQIDTIATRIVYDIKRRTIEQVDTVGATKTYEIRKRVLKRTVMLDTLTETEDKEQTVAFQKGDYKLLDEKVENDSAVKIVDYQQEKREAAEARAKAMQDTTTQSSTGQSSAPRESTTPQPSVVESPPSQARTNPSTPPATEKRTQNPPTEATPQDTTQERSESGR